MEEERQRPDLAFLFPGQGSQAVGMLQDLAAAFPQVRETFAEASEALGFDLWRLVQEGPAEKLDQTVNTQPALLAAGVAVWRVWQSQTDACPAWMAGHSLGEYTALVCAGSLPFPDTVKLVAERGRLMQTAVPEGEGAMAAILGLEDHVVVGLCRKVSEETGQRVAAANFNAPGQVVIAGETAAVERACEAAREAGAKRALKLAVSVPSHCELMKPAAERFAALLEAVPVEMPKIAVIHNVDVGTHAAPEVIRALLAQQLYSPVRWSDTIRFLRDQGVIRFVEAGPGKVLTGLNKRIVKECRTLPVFDPATLAASLEEIV
ncbi:[acyl-carrier-protein] S-malonyltransferase [Methylomarinovum tepidoasis]|uniref:Malonyl CoA-acyl carrier protein transacylase n=1 Tax=Methylomarinovum tepidoasis TaxID=2840183 RepID=A0AAU9CYS3_9GAMM|nr:ACP S-malonyltransferase [Methylomarinovum sp. IN45]BCX87789.1 [acyl-carrier-protein] S-malonyltransferase [Methylomarinovum sp. IN45]